MNKTINYMIFLLLLILTTSSFAQYQLKSSVLSNGGIPVTNNSYGIKSTLGQTFIGMIDNTAYRQNVGFWYSFRIYLGIENLDDQLPKKFELYQNYPNPFNPATKIKYNIPKTSHVKIEIYSILGHKISTLVNENKPAGFYTIEFDAGSLASGFYIYRLQANGYNAVKKMMLIK